jgi:PAS domain S-box-containing protein
MPQTKQSGLFTLHPSYQKKMKRTGIFLLLLALIQVTAWLIPPQFGPTGVPNYLPLHVLFETVSIIVAMLVFAVGWNSRSRDLPGNVVLLACVFFAIGWLDFSHTLAYKGMPDFYTANDAQKQLNFWMSARFMAAFILLFVAIRIWTPLRSAYTRYVLMGGLLSIIILINWVVLFHQNWLPDTFIPGQGLTPLKKNLEYFYIALNIITALILYAKMRTEQTFSITNLFAAACVMAMSEFYFTLYTTMTGGYNILGHVYKVISYLFIYRAIVVEAIEYPYNLLAKTQLNLNLALKGSNTGLWDWDLSTNIVNFSPEWKAQLGYTDNELKNNFSTWESLLHPEDKESALSIVQEFITSKHVIYKNEFRLRHKEGSYRWILAQGEKQFDEKGNLVRIVGSHIDMSDRVEASNQFKNIVEAASNAMLMINKEGTIVISNSETTNTFGYSKDELLGQSISTLIPEEHRHGHEKLVHNFISQSGNRRKMGVGRELFGLHKDGSKIPIEVGLSPIESNNQKYVIATVVDITERKSKEKEALTLREQVSQATKMESVGHLTAGIAHDFNNILGAMMGYSELSQHMLAAGKNDAVKRYQDEILNAGNRAKQLILQMLTFSRLAPDSKYEAPPITLLSSVVKEVVSLLRSSIPSTVELNYHITDDQIKARIQPVNLHQIILNLGVNARDAMGEYGKIDISLSEYHGENTLCSSCNSTFSGSWAQISVKDNGSGIPEHLLKKIFDPFYTSKEVGKGTGLGLSVVHGLVHSLGGHIHVETSSSNGTTFNILIPLETSKSIQVTKIDASPLINIKNTKIMVVDDELAISSMLQEFLSAHGAEVLAFTNSIQAMEAFILNADTIDLVITDETMPGMSGMLLAETILKLKPDLPIILCTGYSDHANPASVAKIGIKGFFTKPIDLTEIMHKIQTLLAAPSA